MTSEDHIWTGSNSTDQSLQATHTLDYLKLIHWVRSSLASCCILTICPYWLL